MEKENRKKILIIEDQVDIAKTLQTKIAANGFDVITAFDGDEGLQSALQNHPDLILLDLILPKLDGMSVLKQIREDEWGKNVPIFILSNLGTGDEIEKSKEYNVNEFLIKTEWSLDEVIGKLQTFFNI